MVCVAPMAQARASNLSDVRALAHQLSASEAERQQIAAELNAVQSQHARLVAQHAVRVVSWGSSV